MLDFLLISVRSSKKGTVEIYPKFMIRPSKDLMIRGSDFYAIWNNEAGFWSTEEDVALALIDKEIDEYYKRHEESFKDISVKRLYMWDAENGMIDRWHKYCQKQCRDNYHMLDEKLIFSDTEVKREDYASKQLTYPLQPTSIDHYEHLMSVLYSPEERKKIEWAIGSIITGDSRKIQKFEVLYGAAGTGKSTILNIIQMLFDGYFCVFDAKALGSANAVFALEAFKTNPLVAIQHDGDLSKIEDNTRLNSLVSHELMTVNEKFKSTYASRFKCFLFMGTNRPVRITDAKSGIIRRLIDVSPTGNKIPLAEYKNDISGIKFELGGIACHCRDVYLADPDAYEEYIPVSMLGASNDFYNFVEDSYDVFKNENATTLKQSYAMYKTYCEDANVAYPYSKRAFKEEFKNYWEQFDERKVLDDGTTVYNYYSGFKIKLGGKVLQTTKGTDWLTFEQGNSVFDLACSDCPAQYATAKGTPIKKWANVTTMLKDINTTRQHFVKVPINLICIDFDIPGPDGKKNFDLNFKAASKWPPTYAELSRSGEGIHLYYWYIGDPLELQNFYDDHIEIKVYNGNSALRRMVTLCNTYPIAEISSGLPLKPKKEMQMVNFNSVQSEKGLREMVKRNLNKEIHPGTKPSIDFIYKILDDAYTDGLKYDVSDMRNAVLAFAAGSTNHADYCVKLVSQMKFKSVESSDGIPDEIGSEDLVFFDCEVFPNLFIVNYKFEGEDKPVIRMINPKPIDIEELLKYKLVGYNCRRYDNHILYARMMGYSNEQLFHLSQMIVTEGKGFFGEAYNVSYMDIYELSSKKQSLKKWEIELGIHHKELGFKWDEPVPEEKWILVAEYCDNDVIATEAVYNARQGDVKAHGILADLSGGTMNDTTNQLTTRFIFGNNRKPQDSFNYRDLSAPIKGGFTYKEATEWALSDAPISEFKYSVPYFPGYLFEKGVSTYRGEEIGEGGKVYAEPGMYGFAKTWDVASMHPSSAVAENLFGDEYTDIFHQLLMVRILIKHKNFEEAGKLFGGKLKRYLDDPDEAKALSYALKIAINSVYGLTAAKFDNPFRDPRNVDNIVAKRGALFMTDLKFAVQELGYHVIHIKTDSIKIDRPDERIGRFIERFGQAYGYSFEVEDVWDRICLVNDAVFVGRTEDGKWTATGAQFAVPYVFKNLFSHEPITFSDKCETKSVSKGELYLDMNENLPEGEHDYQFVGRVGAFCPIKPREGGGILYRYADDKYYAATGTKGYRWLEAEDTRQFKSEEAIDISYYEKLVKKAQGTLIAYGNLDEFLDISKTYMSPSFMNPPVEEVPFDED